jgi:hypothetical protein
MSDPMSDPMSEQQQTGLQPYLASALLEGWLRAFLNRAQPYAVQQPDGTYRWVYEDCTAAVLAAHVAGDLTLALSSTDARGWGRWACLDVDVPGSLPQLLALRDALAEAAGLTGLMVGSRRGGHLWLLLDEPVPAMALRYAIRAALAEISAQGVEVPAHELYPDTGSAGALGHAVRLPLGIHRKTGLRYPPYDTEGLPCVFSSPERAAAYILEATSRIPGALMRGPWEAFLASGGSHSRHGVGAPASDSPPAITTVPRVERPHAALPPHGERMGTRSTVIRWVDAHITPLDLLAELAPETEMKRVGRGYLGWCPFHDDRAWDASGRPGMPSFYVVHDQRYGWSWRCLSTNCAQSTGPMRHSFRLIQELLGFGVGATIGHARDRWPACAPEVWARAGISANGG